MRRALIAGNWKMNKTPREAALYAKELKRELADVVSRDILIIPPFPALHSVGEVIKGSNIMLGGQNVHFEERGAFTGEVSCEMLLDLGCSFVIVGHSERRKFFYEDDEVVNRKVKIVLSSGLTPILCIGETLEEREQAKTFSKVEAQLIEDLRGISLHDISRIVIAYEPVWAIGTGRNATPTQIEEVHSFLRNLLRTRFQPFVAESVRILYGGSVTSSNIDGIMSTQDVDGVLVGGASLRLTEFDRIVKYR